MIRRRYEEDDDNAERWLVSYADFITLLFAFFVVMYSVSTFKKVQHAELTQAINAAFSKKPAADNPTANQNASEQATHVQTPPLPADIKTKVLKTERTAMTALGKTLANILSPLIKKQQARVMQNSSGLHIVILDSALFADGSPDLTEAGGKTIKAITQPLQLSQHTIVVEGHTDNIPIHIKNAAFFSSWELSAVRASSIVGTLSDYGVAKTRLSALGYGPSQPITSNNTPEGRALNRHTSILVLYDTISMGHEPGVEIAPAPPTSQNKSSPTESSPTTPSPTGPKS